MRTASSSTPLAAAVGALAPWECWVVALSGYPAEDGGALRAWYQKLVEAVLKENPLVPDLALQINELHLGDGAALVQERCGREQEVDEQAGEE